MMERKLKVYETKSSKGIWTSQIRLQGDWVEDLGFEPGDHVIVKGRHGRLVLTLQKKGLYE